MAEKEQLAVSYATFILQGQGAEITVDSINAVLKAADVKVSAPFVAAVAKALKGRSVTQFFGVGGGSDAQPADNKKGGDAKKQGKQKEGGKQAGKDAGKDKGGKKEAPPPPPPPADEDGMDMGGLFD